jgi:hypothetical protein
MLAGGMTIAAPSMMPQAAAAGALYVSAENALFNNTFGGAQVIEVVVIDQARNETDEAQGEPVVKVDENQLRMVQAVDGNWYGYFGDGTTIPNADNANNNLDFGTADTAPAIIQGDFSEAAGVYSYSNMIHVNQALGVLTNVPEMSAWNGTTTTLSDRTSQINATQGQIGIQSADQWPFIQLYNFTSGDYAFDVVYEQAGADEVVSLVFDSGDLDEYASLTLDRSSASQGSDVHLTITDNQLNIDPTAEDIIKFRVAEGSEGVSFTNRDAAATYRAYDNYFGDNGKLIIDYNANSAAVAVLVNDATLDDVTADTDLVFYEYGENSGIFLNTDDNDDSNLDIGSYAKRGTTALFDYNDAAQTLVVQTTSV